MPLRHNLDVMHIEKNICESIIGTLLNISGKIKGGLNGRKDLEDMEVREEMQPKVDEGGRLRLLTTSFTLTKNERRIFCKRLFDLKLPDAYSSNIGNCVSVDECKITGLKSHDCHILMQQLLPPALKGLLTKGPMKAIFRMC